MALSGGGPEATPPPRAEELRRRWAEALETGDGEPRELELTPCGGAVVFDLALNEHGVTVVAVLAGVPPLTKCPALLGELWRGEEVEEATGASAAAEVDCTGCSKRWSCARSWA